MKSGMIKAIYENSKKGRDVSKVREKGVFLVTLHAEIWHETVKPGKMMDTQAFVGDDHPGLTDTCWVGGSVPQSLPELHVTEFLNVLAI